MVFSNWYNFGFREGGQGGHLRRNWTPRPTCRCRASSLSSSSSLLSSFHFRFPYCSRCWSSSLFLSLCEKCSVKKSNTEESPNYTFAGSPLQTWGDRWCFTFAGVALAGPRGPTCCTWTGDCLQKSTWCGIQALTTQFPKCLRYNQKSPVIPRTRKISTWMRKHNPQMLTPRWRRCWNDLTRILKQPS